MPNRPAAGRIGSSSGALCCTSICSCNLFSGGCTDTIFAVILSREVLAPNAAMPSQDASNHQSQQWEQVIVVPACKSRVFAQAGSLAWVGSHSDAFKVGHTAGHDHTDPDFRSFFWCFCHVISHCKGLEHKTNKHTTGRMKPKRPCYFIKCMV